MLTTANSQGQGQGQGIRSMRGTNVTMCGRTGDPSMDDHSEGEGEGIRSTFGRPAAESDHQYWTAAALRSAGLTTHSTQDPVSLPTL